MPSPAVAVLLPRSERQPVIDQLRTAGFEPVAVADSVEMAALLAARKDIAVAILDIDDHEVATDTWSLIHAEGRDIAGLLVLSESTLEHLAADGGGHAEDEFVTRPYTAESIRWRVEAMCIRSVAADGAGVTGDTEVGAGNWAPRGALLAVFNPKGGVGKTMLATNLAATLVSRKGRNVLLVDADTVTGHVTVSLGIEGAPTVTDAWRDELDGGPAVTFDQLASTHSSGLRVLALASSPINTEILDPQRVAQAITVARRGTDYVIVDLHPSYSPLNRAVFDRADRILVPVTPDLPAIRAAVQLRDVAAELGMLEKLSLVVNRANSGVSVGDIEAAIGMTAFATIRSGGMLMVRSANEGKPVVELAPKEKITADFDTLADRLIGAPSVARERTAFGLFTRASAALRA